MSALITIARASGARRLSLFSNFRQVMSFCSAPAAPEFSTPLSPITKPQSSVPFSADTGPLDESTHWNGDAQHLEISSNLADDEQAVNREKKYVRLAGPASYATRDDVVNFLQEHGLEPPARNAVVQGQSDVFQNHSIWLIETDSQSAATNIASCISGRVLGLKLVRAAAVDRKLYDRLVAAPVGNARTASLRKRLTIIGPKSDERGRTLLIRQLKSIVSPRAIWAFFSSYGVTDVRYLRKSGVACVVFESDAEANRALRERKNVQLQRQHKVLLKMHE